MAFEIDRDERSAGRFEIIIKSFEIRVAAVFFRSAPRRAQLTDRQFALPPAKCGGKLWFASRERTVVRRCANGFERFTDEAARHVFTMGDGISAAVGSGVDGAATSITEPCNHGATK